MNLKLKRVVRTPYSEEIAIFDNGTRDANDDAVSIGKLEVHYLSDQIVGTLLIWAEYAQGYKATHGPESDETLDDVIDAILSEVSEAVGVATEYGIEVYYPSVTNQSFISNYADEDDGDEEDEEEYETEDGYDAEEDDLEDAEESGVGSDETPGAQDDDYHRKLASR